MHKNLKALSNNFFKILHTLLSGSWIQNSKHNFCLNHECSIMWLWKCAFQCAEKDHSILSVSNLIFVTSNHLKNKYLCIRQFLFNAELDKAIY